MKKLAILLAMLALAGCGDGKRLKDNELAVPVWACSQVPTGQTELRPVSEYCGKGCRRDVPRTHYAVEVKCSYIEWKQQ